MIITNFAPMNFNSTCLPYRQTAAFSRIVLDYIDQSPALKPFYQHGVSMQGIEAAIKQRDSFATNRQVSAELIEQYKHINRSAAVTRTLEN